MNTKKVVLFLALLSLLTMGCLLTNLIGQAIGVDERIQQAKDIADGLAEDAGLQEGLESLDLEEEIENLDLDGESPQRTPGSDQTYVPDALDQLESYRMSIQIRTEMADGNVEEQYMQITRTKNPDARDMSITGLLDGETTEEIRLIQIEDQQWIKAGEEWIQSQMAQENLETTGDMDDIVEDVADMIEDARNLGLETINGVRARHYALDDAQYLEDAELLVDNVQDVRLDFWVAEESNLPPYLVRSEYEVRGSANGEDGIISYLMIMDVTDVNQDLTVTPPAAGETGGGVPDDVPLLEERANMTAVGGMILYTTPRGYQEVLDFYTRELENQGWQKQSTVLSSDALTVEEWKKDGRTLNLNVASEEGAEETSVTIMISE